MSIQLTAGARRTVAELPPSHPKFRNLDATLIALESAPRQPRRALLQVRRRWIERNVPAFMPSKGGR